jgi:drug/metabolite transporter (DMT)-like permease
MITSRMSAFFALLSAALVGAADFLGGVASRRMWPVRVAARSQAVGLLVSLPVAVAVGADRVTRGDIAWALASGVTVGVGLAFFYSALAVGQISVVAPVTALVGTVLPIGVGLARGERPGAPALIGIAAAVVAVAIVSIAPTGGAISIADGRRALVFSAVSGLCFGLFLICLAQLGSSAGLWAAPISRFASAGLLAIVVVASRRPEPGPVRGGWKLIAAIGTLEISAVCALVLAFRDGTLAIPSVLASLYPVTTVLLAAFVLHERLSRLQLTAVLLALVAVVLISIG